MFIDIALKAVAIQFGYALAVVICSRIVKKLVGDRLEKIDLETGGLE